MTVRKDTLQQWFLLKQRFVLTACCLLMALGGCGRKEKPRDFVAEAEAAAVVWGKQLGADQSWRNRIGPFSLQVEEALLQPPGRRLLLVGAFVHDVIRSKNGVFKVLLNAGDDSGGRFEPHSISFLLDVSESDARRLTALQEGYLDLTGVFNHRLVVDCVVAVTNVRKTATYQTEAIAEGDDGSVVQVPENRFFVTGRVIALGPSRGPT